MSIYHYSKTIISNLLSFAKLIDECYIIYKIRVDNAIYVQSKDIGKYLLFQRDHKFNLYCMNISKVDMDKHFYLNTVKKEKIIFSILDQQKAEAIRILQERCRNYKTLQGHTLY